ncbi:MAG: efflux RND transporter periplasmic adaptor subunit [Woeseiaceae bacterium]|jgi:membrane fusion protein (multidrug efflux system)
MKTTKPIIAILALMGSALLAGCGVGEASVSDEATAEKATPVPVEVAQAYRTNIYATYMATATITSDADAPVVARVAGEIVELLVEEGDRVVQGQVLARLDGERLRLEMLSAKANLKQARTEFERNKDLHARGLVSASMFDNLQYDLEELEATYKLKQLTYDYSSIRAPIAGVVSAREVKPGQHLDANDVAFRITETSELLAHLQIPQSELSKFAAGQTASIQVASMPGKNFPATIARVSPTIDARNGTFRATAIIENKKGDLAPGMFGRFTIAYEQHTDALVIPAAALLDEDDVNTVYVVSDGEVVRRDVDVGILADGNIEILNGLSENEFVVVVGQSGLRNGSKVLASTKGLESFTG